MIKPTKDRILDAAEQLFAKGGFDDTSLRDITAAAGVNLAAVNYHFQSKEALILAVFERRIAPINERRLRMLEEAEARAAGGPVPAEDILRAFIEPVLEVGPNLKQWPFARLVGRLYLCSENLFDTVFQAQFRTIKQRFGEVLSRSFPELTPAEVFWRMHFSIGAFAHILAGLHHISSIAQGFTGKVDLREITEHMIRFLSAGFRAPSGKPQGGSQ